MLYYLRIADIFQDLHSHNDFYIQSVSFYYFLVRANFNTAFDQIYRHNIPICNWRMLWSLGRYSLGREWWTKLPWSCLLLCTARICCISCSALDLSWRKIQYLRLIEMASPPLWLHGLSPLHAVLLDSALCSNLGQSKPHPLRGWQRPLESLFWNAPLFLLLGRVLSGPDFSNDIIFRGTPRLHVLPIPSILGPNRPRNQAEAVHNWHFLRCRGGMVWHLCRYESVKRGREVRIHALHSLSPSMMIIWIKPAGDRRTKSEKRFVLNIDWKQLLVVFEHNYYPLRILNSN